MFIQTAQLLQHLYSYILLTASRVAARTHLAYKLNYLTLDSKRHI